MSESTNIGSGDFFVHELGVRKLQSIRERLPDIVRDATCGSAGTDEPQPIFFEAATGIDRTRHKDTAFAHWIIRVGKEFYYYLTFEFDRLGVSQPTPQSVRFRRDLVENLSTRGHSMEVGRTNLSSTSILNVGNLLLSEFGAYHQIFWNNQHFVRLLVEALVGHEHSSSLSDKSVDLGEDAFFRNMSFAMKKGVAEEDERFSEITRYVRSKPPSIETQSGFAARDPSRKYSCSIL